MMFILYLLNNYQRDFKVNLCDSTVRFWVCKQNLVFAAFSSFCTNQQFSYSGEQN